ncbi:MAG: hypothetical protein U9R37_01190 [Campylobacterota bacterium]|nr:hypothetical protein [Campylobacterota bacterium]
MSYSEIIILGWNLNAFMFVLNLVLAFNIVKGNDPVVMSKEHEKLSSLKEQLDEYYPYRGYETILSYAFPFVAFYRVSWRFIEMNMFFNKNKGTSMFDFMVYKYETDIQKAKN